MRILFFSIFISGLFMPHPNLFSIANEKPQTLFHYYLAKSVITISIETVGYKAGRQVITLTQEQKRKAQQSRKLLVKHKVDQKKFESWVNLQGRLIDNLVTGFHIGKVKITHIPDPLQIHLLKTPPKRNNLAPLCFEINHQGLLHSVSKQTKEQTQSIVINLSQLRPKLKKPEYLLADKKTTEPLSKILELTFDPSERNELKLVNKKLKEMQLKMNFRGLIKSKNNPNSSCPPEHICYRTMKPISLTIENKKNNQTNRRYILLVDQSKLHKIDLTRTFVHENVKRLLFENGVLQSIVMDKHKTVPETMKLPLTLYDAIMTEALSQSGNFLNPSVLLKMKEKTKNLSELKTIVKHEKPRNIICRLKISNTINNNLLKTLAGLLFYKVS